MENDLAARVTARLAHARARAPSAADLVAALREPAAPVDAAGFGLAADAREPVHAIVARGSTWRLVASLYPAGTSTTLHVHRAPLAWRVVAGHAVETLLGQPDRTWATGEVGEIAPGALHQISNPGRHPLLVLELGALEMGAERPRRASTAPPVAASDAGAGRPRRIAIIGGGLSGAAVAYHLAIRATGPLQVTIIERGPWIGRGIAYGIASPIFRLNVPASRMSLDPEKPDDFVRWAGAGATPDVFLARTRYGAYVEDRLGGALASSHMEATVMRAEAVAIDSSGVMLADGRRVEADQVVLATGLVPRQTGAWLAVDPRIVDAWNEPALHFLPADGRLLILGSGLSAIDVLGVLEAAGFRGRVVVMSRHGLLPRPHLARLAPPAAIPPGEVEAAPRDLRGLVSWARGRVREAVAAGMPWQAGFDALRAHVPRLWAALPAADRARFVRTVRPYWEVLRHRAPLDALDVVEEWRQKGRLQLRAGRVVACRPAPDGLEVELRHGGERSVERFDAIVRCIGPALDDSEGEAPLIAGLMASGMARRDPAGLGLVTDPDGRVIGPDGRGSDRLFALGALRRAAAWETTAVPEISRQAMALAALLVRT